MPKIESRFGNKFGMTNIKGSNAEAVGSRGKIGICSGLTGTPENPVMIEAFEPIGKPRAILCSKKEWGKRKRETCASSRQL